MPIPTDREQLNAFKPLVSTLYLNFVYTLYFAKNHLSCLATFYTTLQRQLVTAPTVVMTLVT
jgi:hypothetical protein